MPIDTVIVLSPYHPANENSHRNGSGTYTYNPAIPTPIFSLGWELEANHSATRVPAGVQTISDGSVNGDGTEYVVSPAVTRSPRFVLGLLKDLVHAPKLNTDKSCGFHVHMSIQNASLPRLRNWAIATEALAKDIEDIAFKAVPDARQSNSYCRRIQEITAGTRFEATKYNNSRRYHWLNTVEIFRPSGIRTLEVRLLGNTHRWKYLLSWVTFSLLLGREGWKVAHRPFESRRASVKMLTEVLEAIIADVKPLDKRSEPIPAWVYSQLKSLGIEFSAFERPLIALANTEAELAGRLKKFYSDNQATEENNSSDDDDSCPCGCGEDGRCQSQCHDDGDCDSNDCTYCHSDGNCGGSPDCYECVRSRHEDDEYCGGDRCRVCERSQRGPWAVSEDEDEETTEAAPSVATSSNVTIHTSNVLPSDRAGVSGVLTAESMRAAVETLRAQSVAGPEVQEAMTTMIRDSVLYGTHNPARVCIDEASTVRVNVEPLNIEGRTWIVGETRTGRIVTSGIDDPANYAPDMEQLANGMMTQDEQIQSMDRSTFYNGGDR